jgi:hypothetical protein
LWALLRSQTEHSTKFTPLLRLGLLHHFFLLVFLLLLQNSTEALRAQTEHAREHGFIDSRPRVATDAHYLEATMKV